MSIAPCCSVNAAFLSAAANSFHRQWIVCDVIGKNIPVPWRSVGIGAIRPEFCQNQGKIAAFDHFSCIGKASDWILLLEHDASNQRQVICRQ